MQDLLKQPVTILNGIGARTAVNLEKIGIKSIFDLLFHLPYRYEDKTRYAAIRTLTGGNTALIKGTIKFIDVTATKRKSLICCITDGSVSLNIRFFHFTANQHNVLKIGAIVSCFGEIRYGYNGLEMVHPEYKVLTTDEDALVETQLSPVYPLTEGLSQNVLRNAVKQALALCEANPQSLTDWLSMEHLAQFQYPTLHQALSTVHAPDPSITIEALQKGSVPHLKRLAFEELLAHHLSLKRAKSKSKDWQAPRLIIDDKRMNQFIDALPFSLTNAQCRVISEITADCQLAHPMLRLVQGDVGSGKTIVAGCAALLALNSNYQVAIMAPTELLAEQHFRNFSEWFSDFSIKIVLLTGNVKGTLRNTLLQDLEAGTVNVVIGTHALFQDEVNFHRLGLMIIDEQHRFGVQQRLALRVKGQKVGLRPHQLVMTATPIPRTLAMLQYSDLDISIIDELPPNRKPVTTSVIPSERRQEVIERINAWVGSHKQAYWVCTLIEESDILQCEAAENTAEFLATSLPEVRIALIHGRMKSTEKDAIMLAFKKHEIDLLVATTVIEVGVDVPNASLMIIENPERLGLAQLHQLRGRVGRGIDDSYCLLLYQSPLSKNARLRLGVLRDSNDGFFIAEKDLLLRGPGEVMGTRQTGQVNFKVADLLRDQDLLDNIPVVAEDIVKNHPESIAPLLERWLGQRSDYTEV